MSINKYNLLRDDGSIIENDEIEPIIVITNYLRDKIEGFIDVLKKNSNGFEFLKTNYFFKNDHFNRIMENVCFNIWSDYIKQINDVDKDYAKDIVRSDISIINGILMKNENNDEG